MPLNQAESTTALSNQLHDPAQVLDTAIEDTTERVFLIGPSVALIRELATRFGPAAESPPVSEIRILAEESSLDTATDDTLTEYRLAAAVETEALTIRAVNPEADTVDLQNGLPNIILTESTVLAIVNPGYITESSPEYVEQVSSRYTSLWERAESYGSFSRTPTLEEIQNTAREQLSTDYAADLRAVFDVVDTLGTRDDAIGVEDVMFALGAQQEATQYDIGKFCEDAQIVSKATLSRVKGFYEDIEAIGTTRVPQAVGRPRD